MKRRYASKPDYRLAPDCPVIAAARDTAVSEVRILRKKKAKRPTHPAPVKPAAENVVNLMDALRRSIAAEKRPAAKECLTCGHTAVLTPRALSRFSIGPNAPIAAFVKRVRCHRCGSQSVLATRKPAPQKAS